MQNAETLFAIFCCKKRREEKNAESIGEKAENRQNGCCRKPQAGGCLFLLGCKKGYVKKRAGTRPLFSMMCFAIMWARRLRRLI